MTTKLSALWRSAACEQLGLDPDKVVQLHIDGGWNGATVTATIHVADDFYGRIRHTVEERQREERAKREAEAKRGHTPFCPAYHAPRIGRIPAVSAIGPCSCDRSEEDEEPAADVARRVRDRLRRNWNGE